MFGLDKDDDNEIDFSSLPTPEEVYRERYRSAGIESSSSNPIRRLVADPLVGLAKGMAVGIPETAVGLLDIPTMGYAGKVAETVSRGLGLGDFKSANEMFDNLLTPETREAQQKVAEAKGFLPTIATAIQNPSSIVQTVAESIPSMVGGMRVAGGIAKLVGKPLVEAGIANLPRIAKVGGIAEGVITAGQNVEQTRQQTEEGTLTPFQVGINTVSGILTGMIGVTGGRLAQRFGLEDIDTLLTNGWSGIVGDEEKEIFKKVLMGAFQEGVLEELPQSMQEQIAQNLALNKPIDDGVFEAGAMGMLAGFAQSTGANIAGSTMQKMKNELDPINQTIKKIADETLPGELNAIGGWDNGKLVENITPTAVSETPSRLHPSEIDYGEEISTPLPTPPEPSPESFSTGLQGIARELNVGQFAPLTAEETGVESVKKLAHDWDMANRTHRSDSWFEGAKANEESRNGFNEALSEGGDQLQAHGMAKESTLSGAIDNLTNILMNGLDQTRRGGILDTAPLANRPGEGLVGATATGSAYSEGPFQLVAKKGAMGIRNQNDIAAILVNQEHANMVPALRQHFQSIIPNIIVDSYSNAGKVTKQIVTDTRTEQKNALPAPEQKVGMPAPVKNIIPAPELEKQVAGAPEVSRGGEQKANKVHRPVKPENGSSLDDLTNSFSEDIYSKNALEYFGEGNSYDKQSINLIKSLKNKPDADVKIYRTVDKGVKDFNSGDWVTINKNYAVEHGEGIMGGKYDIIEKTVKAKNLISSGDSLHEFGYYPETTRKSEGKTGKTEDSEKVKKAIKSQLVEYKAELINRLASLTKEKAAAKSTRETDRLERLISTTETELDRYLREKTLPQDRIDSIRLAQTEIAKVESMEEVKSEAKEPWNATMKSRLETVNQEVAQNREKIIAQSKKQAEYDGWLDKWTPEKAIDSYYREHSGINTSGWKALKKGETWKGRLEKLTESEGEISGKTQKSKPPITNQEQLKQRLAEGKRLAAEKRAEAAGKPIAKSVEAVSTKEPWQTSDLAVKPNIKIESIHALKQSDGKFKLFYRGTRNEVFPGNTFNSATDARNFFSEQKNKAFESNQQKTYVSNTKKVSTETKPAVNAQKKITEADPETLSLVLHEMRSELETGTPGGFQGHDENGNPIYAKSGYQEWFSDLVKKYGNKKTSPTGEKENINAKYLVNIINKGLKNDKLTSTQSIIWEDVNKIADHESGKTYAGLVNQFEKIRELQNETRKQLAEEEINAGEIAESKDDLISGASEILESEGYSPEQLESNAAEITSFFNEMSKEPSATKQSWEQTREEFVGEATGDERAIRLAAHAQHVKQAIADGERVPLEVLNNYKNNGWAQIAIDKIKSKGDVQTELAGTDSFNLANPETEISKKLPEQSTPKNEEIFGVPKEEKVTTLINGRIEDAPIILYSKDLKITNLDVLPKGVGANYLLAIKGENGEFIAKQWRRTVPSPMNNIEVLIDFKVKKATDTNEIGAPKDVSFQRGKSVGLQQSQVQSVIDQALKSISTPPKVNIIQSNQDCPESVQKIMEEYEIDDAMGFTHNGEVYLVANNIRNEEEILRTMAHELTHSGLGKFFQRQTQGKIMPVRAGYEALMDAIYRAHTEEVEQLSKTTHTHLNTRTVQGRRQACEEWLCNQSYESQPKWYDKLVAIFNDLLRAVGLNVKLSDAEVRVVLQDAFKEFGNRQIGVRRSQPMFSRSDNPDYKWWEGMDIRKQLESLPFKSWQKPRDFIAEGYVPITRAEADKLYYDGMDIFVARVDLKGAETTGNEGWFMRPRSSFYGYQGYNYDETYYQNKKAKKLYQKYSERYSLSERGREDTVQEGMRADTGIQDGLQEVAFSRRVFGDLKPLDYISSYIPDSLSSWFRQTSTNSVPPSDISQTNGTWEIPASSTMNTLNYILADRNIDLRDAVKSIEKTHGILEDQKNTSLKETLFSGRLSSRLDDFVNNELHSVISAMAKNGISIAQIEEYLHARHAEEANDYLDSLPEDKRKGNAGISTEDANDYLDSLDPALKEKYEKIALMLDKITHKNAQLLVDYGLESQETIDKWFSKYKHYVPLFREDIEERPGTGQGFTVAGSASKGRTGSERKVVHILSNIAMQRERTLTRGEKNRVSQSLVSLAENFPNEDFWKIIKIPRLSAFIAPGIEAKIKPNVVVARIKDEETGEIKHIGVQFNENNKRAMRMAAALKNMDMDNIGEILGTLGKITRYVSAINTQYNPVFGVTNFFRDMGTAAFNLSTTPIAGKQKEVLSNVLPAMKGIWQATKGNESSEMAKLFKDFQLHGGQTGYRNLFVVSQDRAKAIEKELKSLQAGKPRRYLSAFAKILSDYNTMSENSIRLSAYKVGIESGMTKDKAASMAKNLTVNFNKKGQIAGQAGALYAFFNASVQGAVRMYETLKGPMGYKIIAGGIIFGAAQAMMLAAAGFKDEEPPEFVKERNVIIPIGDKKYITFPMPLGFNVIPNVGRILAEITLGGGKNAGVKMSGLIGIIMETFNPLGSSGLSMQTVAPTFLDPFVALAENKNWTGRPIYKEDFNSLNPTPGTSRVKDSATALGRGLAWAFNILTGGNKYTPGLFSPTPDQIDYLSGQITGGLGREIGKTSMMFESLYTGEELPAYKLPLTGRFYGTVEGQANESNKYYSNLKKLNVHEANIKGRIKDREPVSQYIKDNPEAKLWRMANTVENTISRIKKRRESARTPEAKKIYDKLITLQMKRLNDMVEKAGD